MTQLIQIKLYFNLDLFPFGWYYYIKSNQNVTAAANIEVNAEAVATELIWGPHVISLLCYRWTQVHKDLDGCHLTSAQSCESQLFGAPTSLSAWGRTGTWSYSPQGVSQDRNHQFQLKQNKYEYADTFFHLRP